MLNIDEWGIIVFQESSSPRMRQFVQCVPANPCTVIYTVPLPALPVHLQIIFLQVANLACIQGYNVVAAELLLWPLKMQ